MFSVENGEEAFIGNKILTESCYEFISLHKVLWAKEIPEKAPDPLILSSVAEMEI